MNDETNQDTTRRTKETNKDSHVYAAAPIATMRTMVSDYYLRSYVGADAVGWLLAGQAGPDVPMAMAEKNF